MADMFYEMLYLQSAESLLSENMEFHLEAQIHIQYKTYGGADLYQLCYHLAKKKNSQTLRAMQQISH